MRPLLRSLPLLALLGAPAAAQSLRGRVLDAATDRPVAGVAVSLLDSAGRAVHRARSGADGRFVLRVRGGGTYRLFGERAGYALRTSGPLEVGPRDTVQVELRMSERALAIDPLTVTARRQPRRVQALADRGFYDRERRGLGDFLQRDDIGRGAPIRLSQVLDRVPGTTLIRGGFTDVVLFDRSAGTGVLRPGGGSMCPPRIYLDGTAVSSVTPDLVPPESVEAVEMYHGASQIPVEYNDARAACGVILIWTRTGP